MNGPSLPHLAWVKSRIDYLTQRFSFEGATVLEFGSFNGDIAAELTERGADVTCVEGKLRNIKIINRRFPHLKVIHHDLDKPEWPFEDFYAFIIHMGLLYQQNPEYLLMESQRHCGNLILESQVIDSDEEIVKILSPDNHGPGQGLNAEARLSVGWVEKRLANYQMIFDQTINSGHHQYTWKAKNDKSYRTGKRRMWVTHPIDTLLDSNNDLEFGKSWVNK